MGRKGIGKLSLFSIANIVRVETVKAEGKNGFKMSVKEIEDLINEDEGQDEQTPYKQTPYIPHALSENDITLNQQGTRIVLTELKKRVTQASATALQKRLARRFSVIGTNDFNVIINGKRVTVTDRDYFHKIQYLWHFGDGSENYIQLCKSRGSHKLEHSERQKGDIEIVGEDDSKSVKGWIGTVLEPKDLKDKDGDNLNKIVIMVRGKLAHENMLEDFPEARIYTKYLMGEIHADFLDVDSQPDIATSNRQEIIKDDPRYIALREWVGGELKNIRNQWTELRHKAAIEDVRQIPSIADWLDGLREDIRELAHDMFGKMNEHILDDENDRVDLYKQGIFMFEKLRYKGLLGSWIRYLRKIFRRLLKFSAAWMRLRHICTTRLFKSG